LASPVDCMWTSVRWKPYHHISLFVKIIPQCDRQTNRRTERQTDGRTYRQSHSYYCAQQSRRAVNWS